MMARDLALEARETMEERTYAYECVQHIIDHTRYIFISYEETKYH